MDIDAIKECMDNNIEITGNLFNRNAKETQKIVDICKKYRVPITSSIFLKSAKEVERIIIVCRENNISVIRKINQKARDFFSKLKNSILYEIRPANYKPLYTSQFYLNYNEFGVKKRCYSNLRALKIGLTENKYLKNNP